MLSELLARLGVTPSARNGNPGALYPFGWAQRGSLRGAANNADVIKVTDYRSPSAIAVGTLQAIETMYGQQQTATPTTRVGTITPYNGNRFMGYADVGQRMVGSSLLTSAANPALNRRAGLPATQPIGSAPLSPMQTLLLQSANYDVTPTGLVNAQAPQ